MFFVKRRSDTPFALWGSNWNTALLFAELLQKLTAVVPVFGRRFVKKVREKRILPPSAEEVEKTLRKFSFTKPYQKCRTEKRRIKTTDARE